MFIITLTILTTFIVVFLEYVRRKHSYWRYRGIYSPPGKFIVGHVGAAMSKTEKYWTFLDKQYRENKSRDFVGMYTVLTPVLMVFNPTHIREILQIAFEHFPTRSHEMKPNSEQEKVVTDFLTNLSGRRWKYVRSKVSPLFSSGKLKGMFPLISKTGDDLIKLCDTKMKTDGVVDVSDVAKRYVLEVISNVVMGINGECLGNGDSKFNKEVAQAIQELSSVKKLLVHRISPTLFKLLGLSMSNKHIRELSRKLKKTIEERIRSGTKRGDFVDLLIEAMENASGNETSNPDNAFTIETTVAQSLIFLFAGYTSTAASLSFMLYILATNPEQQEKLREEILSNMADENFTYANVMEGTYLDACLNECLRIYPFGFASTRNCQKSYHIPDTSVIVQKGFTVLIPTYSIHHDAAYWPEPEKFRPERFLPENKTKIKPFTYFPFGAGPRACIGLRFAQMEMKIAICKLLMNYDIKLQPGFEMVLTEKATEMSINEDGLKVILTKLDK